MPKDDTKYWNDYSIFIETVENITGFSPSDLLKRYEELISELSEGEENYLEWQYESEYNKFTRKEIQRVIENPNLSSNVLLKAFREKIDILDLEFKKYIENANDLKWWENPKVRF